MRSSMREAYVRLDPHAGPGAQAPSSDCRKLAGARDRKPRTGELYTQRLVRIEKTKTAFGEGLRCGIDV
jgi:hypothetical protein